MFAEHKLRRAGGGVSPVSNLTDRGSFTDGSPGSSRTFNNIPVGDANTDRIVIFVGSLSLPSTQTFTLKVNGVLVDERRTILAGTCFIAWHSLPSGTTCSFEIVASNTMVQLGFEVYTFDSLTAVGLQELDNVVATSTVSVASWADVEIQRNGALFWIATQLGSHVVSSVTWTGTNPSPVDIEETPNNSIIFGGHIDTTEETTTDDLEAVISGSGAFVDLFGLCVTF